MISSGAIHRRFPASRKEVLLLGTPSMALLRPKSMMTADRAYKLLEIPEDTEDEMVITVFNMRVRTVLCSR